MTAGSRRRILVGIAAAVVLAVVGGTPVAAHPLGNFSINHLDSLRFEADRIVDNAIIDTAEIPTAQAESSIDADGDGTASVAELDEYGRSQCEDYRRALALTVDSDAATFATTSSAFSYRSGQAGLRTTRLECGFEAIVALDVPRVIQFSNTFAANRVGWHEIVAGAGGVSFTESTVPTTSVTDGLTTYPVDLLASPLDVRTAKFTVVPGTGAAAATPAVTSKSSMSSTSTFSRALGPFTRVVDQISNTFNELVGRRQLTLGVGLLAIGLALVLGASHALLPGHGKTVMAAYIAGRQGSVRDAVMVLSLIHISEPTRPY